MKPDCEADKTELAADDLAGSCGVCVKDARQCQRKGGGRGRVQCAGFVVDEKKIKEILNESAETVLL